MRLIMKTPETVVVNFTFIIHFMPCVSCSLFNIDHGRQGKMTTLTDGIVRSAFQGELDADRKGDKGDVIKIAQTGSDTAIKL